MIPELFSPYTPRPPSADDPAFYYWTSHSKLFDHSRWGGAYAYVEYTYNVNAYPCEDNTTYLLRATGSCIKLHLPYDVSVKHATFVIKWRVLYDVYTVDACMVDMMTYLQACIEKTSNLKMILDDFEQYFEIVTL